jgi:hypothetical protein
MKKLCFIVAAVATFYVVPAMAVDLTQHLTNFDGQEFVGSDGKALGLTAELAIENALLNAQTSSPDEKTKNFMLALKVNKEAKNFTPTPADSERIKAALGSTQTTVVYGTVMALIDPTFGK